MPDWGEGEGEAAERRVPLPTAPLLERPIASPGSTCTPAHHRAGKGRGGERKEGREKRVASDVARTEDRHIHGSTNR